MDVWFISGDKHVLSQLDYGRRPFGRTCQMMETRLFVHSLSLLFILNTIFTSRYIIIYLTRIKLFHHTFINILFQDINVWRVNSTMEADYLEELSK